jgi:hypothetical protein
METRPTTLPKPSGESHGGEGVGRRGGCTSGGPRRSDPSPAGLYLGHWCIHTPPPFPARSAGVQAAMADVASDGSPRTLPAKGLFKVTSLSGPSELKKCQNLASGIIPDKNDSNFVYSMYIDP